MPSIKRISSKQSIRSPKRSSRRKLFANSTSDSLDTVEQARLQLQHLDTITTSNQKENIKNSTDKAKKKKTNETPSNNNNLNDKEIITVSDGETKVKRKRKTRAELRGFDSSSSLRRSVDLKGLESQLTFDLEEDVVTAHPDKKNEFLPNSENLNIHIRSETNARLFIESADGFISTKKVDVERKRRKYEIRRLEKLRLAEQDFVSRGNAHASATMKLAMSSNKSFLTFALFCHGLLAGIAAWQVVTTMTSLHYGYANLHSQYCAVSKPLHCVYFLLFAVCCVSSLDRYDVHSVNRDCIYGSISCETGGLCVPLYVLGMIFHFSLSELDDKISDCNASIWPDDSSRDGDLKHWWILNIARSTCAILGWMSIVYAPSIDRMHTMLENILDEDVLPTEAERPPGV